MSYKLGTNFEQLELNMRLDYFLYLCIQNSTKIN